MPKLCCVSFLKLYEKHSNDSTAQGIKDVYSTIEVMKMKARRPDDWSHEPEQGTFGDWDET